MDPDTVSLATRPARRSDLTVVEMDGELVIYEPDRGAMHKLDTVATALWRCFDGATDLNEIVDDLLAVTRQDRQRLETDVLRYVRELATAGLVHDNPSRPTSPTH